MSITIGLRFRPVDETNNPSEVAREAARARWTEALASLPGVLSYEFKAPEQDPPAERLEVIRRAENVPPVDLTIVLESGNHADALFGNSEMVANLNGLVAGAHAVHAVGGGPQVNGTPHEDPTR